MAAQCPVFATGQEVAEYRQTRPDTGTEQVAGTLATRRTRGLILSLLSLSPRYRRRDEEGA